MACLVSVIIPTHDRAHRIPRTVDSVLNRTYREVEVLVIDGGSRDGAVHREALA